MKNKGYSLVETLVYVLIFTILFGTIVTVTVLLSNSYRNIKALRDIESSAIATMNRMGREIKNSNTVDGTGTVYNVSPGSLLLDTASSTEDVKFYLSSGKIMLQEGTATIGALTLDSVTVTSLIFKPIVSTSSEAVKVEMTLEARGGKGTISKNFYTTAVLRGSYN